MSRIKFAGITGKQAGIIRIYLVQIPNKVYKRLRVLRGALLKGVQ